MNENYYTTQYSEEPPKKKKGKIKTVVALVAAVAIIGGGSGFGGAYLASSLYTSSGSGTSSSSESENYSGTYDNSNLPEDIAAAIDAINASDSSDVSQKTSASSVVATGADGAYTASELYEAVNDTIVLVKVYVNQSTTNYGSYYDYFFGYGEDSGSSRETEPVYAGYGSGIVFTEDGYILTNAHVVDDAAKIVVEVNDYEDSTQTHEYEATVVGSDASTDIAVIKIERSEKFLAAKIGDSDSLKVGQEVCAIGNPGVTGDIMFAHTMTKGIVSGLNRVCLSEGYNLSLIQTDTAINSGNSGGGLFDMYGNVVGVVNSKIITDTFEGIGFALTINEAKPVMEDLLSYGYVKSRPVLGVTTIELNEYRAQLYGVKLTKGLLISAIREDAPVSESGLRVSDIITKINGTNVETVSDVQTIISKFSVGDTITATVARTNEAGTLDSVEIEIELAESSQ